MVTYNLNSNIFCPAADNGSGAKCGVAAAVKVRLHKVANNVKAVQGCFVALRAYSWL